MRIAYIASGAANMYCGTCLHDNMVAAALLKLGHDVALVPTYTPLRTDEADVSIGRVFFGALNVYLQQKAAPFRHTSERLDRWLDRPGLLRRVAKLGASTDPRDLGALTLSVIEGEDGHQAKELEKLVAWLRDDLRPEVVHLNNCMFVGFARRLKKELGVPVLCSLQGEDIFLDQLREPWRARVMAALADRARDIDGFIVNSHYYRDFMARYLAIDPKHLHVVRLGLSLVGHGTTEPGTAMPPDRGLAGRRPHTKAPVGRHGGPGRPTETPLTIGYLARICPEKGLHLLVEAFRLLDEREPGRYRLRAAGYLGERDRRYFKKEVEQRIHDWGLASAFEYLGEVDREGKIRFLQSLDVLSVPAVYREPKGFYVLEALANGVPVVEPRHGAFPEMVEATGGGVLVEPGSAEALAEALRALRADPARRRELGERGRAAVHAGWSDRAEAEATLAVYERVLAARGEPLPVGVPA